MLGLPDGITACLFDLDGVLTQTAEVHARAWKQTFDAFLETSGASSRFDPCTTTTSTSTASRAWTACAPSWPRAASSCPRVARRPAGRARPSTAWQPQERARAAPHPRARASRPTRARCATCRRRATPACGGPSSPRAPTAATCSWRPASRTCSRSASTASSPRSSDLRGKPAPDTFLEAARLLGVAPEQAAVFEDALAGVQAGRAGGFGYVVGVDRAGQREALRAHGADVVVDDLAELL